MKYDDKVCSFSVFLPAHLNNIVGIGVQVS